MSSVRKNKWSADLSEEMRCVQEEGKEGWDEGRKGVREVREKCLTGDGAVSIFMRTDFLFNFNLSVSGGLCLKRHPTPTSTSSFEAHLLTFYMLNKEDPVRRTYLYSAKLQKVNRTSLSDFKSSSLGNVWLVWGIVSHLFDFFNYSYYSPVISVFRSLCQLYRSDIKACGLWKRLMWVEVKHNGVNFRENEIWSHWFCPLFRAALSLVLSDGL